jgi:hypothetical protein
MTAIAAPSKENAVVNHIVSIEVEAESLEEARQQVRSKIAEGCFLLSEEVVTWGGTNTATGRGPTTEAAFAQAQNGLAEGAEVLNREEVVAPGQKQITVEALDEQSATSKAKNQIGNAGTVKSLRLVVAGKKGVFGMGGRPGQYVADVSQQAVVKITYRLKAKIAVEIGRDIRSVDDRQKLDSAERNGTPVGVICDNCGRTCKALPKPVAKKTIMVMTPEIAMIAARYCEKSNIVVCGKCVGVSLGSIGPSLGGRRCPKCGEETAYAAVCHLRMTNTKLA